MTYRPMRSDVAERVLAHLASIRFNTGATPEIIALNLDLTVAAVRAALDELKKRGDAGVPVGSKTGHWVYTENWTTENWTTED